jgi:enoyl-CoA hydratase/carnithine racemase
VVAPGEALAEATVLAGRLAAKPAQALLATKTLMKSPTPGLHARIAEENAAFHAQLHTDEVRAIVAGFFQSRAKASAA